MMIDHPTRKLERMLLAALERQGMRPPEPASLRSLMDQFATNAAKIISSASVTIVKGEGPKPVGRVVAEIRRRHFRLIDGGRGPGGRQ